MCRITAFVPKHNYNISTTGLLPFINVLEVNGSTNKDGVGVSILEKDRVTTFKKSKEAVEFLVNGQIFDFLKSYNSQKLLGHVRLATTGKGNKDDKNAHPFTFDTLTGVHNGHFSNWNTVLTKNECKEKIEVDSEAFFWRLNQIRLKHAETSQELSFQDIQDCVSEFTGNFAISVYDSYADKLWIIPCQNDLYLFDLGYAYLVNTSSMISPVLNYTSNLISFISTTPKLEFSPAKITSETAFILDGSGLHPVGKLVLPKANEYEYGYYYNTPAYTSTTVNRDSRISTKEVKAIIDKKNTLQAKYGLSFLGFKDLVNSLEQFSTYDGLVESEITLLDEFLDWLKKGGFLDDMEKKNELWKYIYRVETNEYKYSAGYVQDFLCPFWLNSLEDIGKITVPDVGED